MTELKKSQLEQHSASRREVLKQLAIGATGIGLAGHSANLLADDANVNFAPKNTALKGNIHHSVARWTFGDLSVEELCQVANKLGFSAIDLVGPDDWPTLKKYGINSSMCNGAELNLTDGWGDSQFHDELIKRYHRHIDLVADAGYVNLICFSGNKRGMAPEEGLDNAVKGLRQILPHAEKRGVVLQMELFNSKVDHPDYFADNSAWGIALCKRLNSPNFKLLYDIYHMQISEGDIIRTITDNHQYFGHYHTAGVPGRHEIDDSQELFYPAIARAILNTGFKGYLAQEFIPTPDSMADKVTSLQNAIHICDV
ncbi:TIM barrel protein [Neptunicella marina]|uniref:TIM barrel protein n=1 Tax=Neptunicella marina TaxID=2125989 RepID=A0A8J6IUU9_9ALTE|nr:TIM barrel protein [Neptunicella marina]